MAFPAATSNEHEREGAAQVVAPPGGTGVAAGCYDTGANRDIFIALINEVRQVLILRGVIVGTAASATVYTTPNEHEREGGAQVAAPAGGTGAIAGGWDTAGNRDTGINLINEMRTAMINKGLMVGTAAAGNTGQTSNEHVREGATQVVAPPGGTGAAAGGWDTAGNRDTAINLMNEMRTVLSNKGWMKGAA